MILSLTTLHLSPDITSTGLDDTESQATKIVTKFLKSALENREAEIAYYGTFIEEEKRDILVLITLWTDLETCRRWERGVGDVGDSASPSTIPTLPKFLTPLLPLLAPSTTPTTLHLPFSDSDDLTRALGVKGVSDARIGANGAGSEIDKGGNGVKEGANGGQKGANGVRLNPVTKFFSNLSNIFSSITQGGKISTKDTRIEANDVETSVKGANEAKSTRYPSDSEDSKEVGVTEIVHVYFPANLSAERRAEIMENNVAKLRPVVEGSEALGVLDSWTLQNLPLPPTATDPFNPSAASTLLSSPDEPCQIFMNLVGWRDVDAHMRFQQSEAFKQSIGLLLGIGEMVGTEVGHVRLRRVEV